MPKGSHAPKGGRARVSRQSLSERIERLYPTLSPQLRRAARYALDAPDDVALGSIREVAENAGVHPTTLVRLARELSYPGYAAFREPFREDLRRQPRRFADRAAALRRRGVASDSERQVAEVADLSRANVTATFNEATGAAVIRAANVLHDARRIYLLGLRKCFPIAYYLHYALSMFRNDVVLLSDGGGALVDRLRDIDERDALVAIGFDPYTHLTVSTCRFSAQRNARVVAITDSQVSPLADGGDGRIVVANDSASFFRSLVAAMAVAETIVGLLLARGGDDAIRMLSRTEEHLDGFSTYWQPRHVRGGAGALAGRS
jgi:DNA-binding MurR/RpiR family transcriptional regulator